jgi:hypothetical protein
MAQYFGMMASYGEPKDKAKSMTIGIAQQLEEHPTEPGEETTGTAIGPKESYRRRKKDIGDIGRKYEK